MGIASSLVNGAFQLFSNHQNAKYNRETNAVNKEIADSTNNANMAMNQANIDFQREINDTNYQRQLAENELTRQREDTAISRSASDMESAGLSKTLAAGNQASSQALNSSVAVAPENKFSMQRYEQKAFQAEALKFDFDILDSLQKIKNIQNTDLQNKYQDLYNQFFENNNILPGTSPWYNHLMGINAVGSGIMDYINGEKVGQESLDEIPDSVPSSVASDIVDSAVNSSVPESSKSHKNISVPTFSRAIVNDLPLESATKKMLSSSVDGVNNSVSSSSSVEKISSWLNAHRNSSSFKTLESSYNKLDSSHKAKLDELSKSFFKNRYSNFGTTLALLAILGAGSANLSFYNDNF